MARWSFLAAVAAASGNSAVNKVVELLEGMKSQVEEDLKNEESLMEEYTTWCAVEDQKLSDSIKTDKKTIKRAQATIADNSAKMEAADAAIGELSAKIAAKQKEVEEAAAARKATRKTNAAKEAELTEGVQTLKVAYRVIEQATKGGAFLQGKMSVKIPKAIEALKAIISAAYISPEHKTQLSAFMQDDELSLNLAQQPQATTSNYNSHSGGILSTVEAMQEDTESQLTAVVEEETKSRHAHELFMQGAANEIAADTKATEDNKKAKASAEEEHGSASGELKTTEESLAADSEQLASTQKECRQKARSWEERQNDAAGEIDALTQAMEVLGKVSVFAQVESKVERMSGSNQARSKVVSMLRKMGHKFNSFGLLQAASMASADPFEKIRGLIQNMIAKLEEQAKSEATKEAMCKEETAKAKKQRAKKEAELDKYTTRLDKASAKSATLAEEIKTLQLELKDLAASVAEATELRNKERKDNKKTIKDNTESSAATGQAIKILREYYATEEPETPASTAFLQAQAPEFGSAQTDKAGPIIGILETAEADFSKLAAETQASEDQAQSEYNDFKQKAEVTQVKKEMESKGKAAEIDQLKSNQNDLNGDIETVNKELDSVMKTLATLRKECANEAMSYEERKQRREAEVAGLQEALTVLSDDGAEGGAFVQKKAFLRRA